MIVHLRSSFSLTTPPEIPDLGDRSNAVAELRVVQPAGDQDVGIR
jgi:hypothetical protein